MDKKNKTMFNNMDMVINHGDKIGFNSIRNQVAEKVINVDKAQNAALDKNEKVDSSQEKALKEAAKTNAAQDKALKENAKVDAAQEQAISENAEAIKAEAEAREAADVELLDAVSALTDALDAEVSDRKQTVADEAYARWQSDEAEATARMEKDAELDEAVSALTDALDAEVEAREAADTELDEKISGINETLEKLLDSKGVQDVIDTFFDVEEFLSGITDSESLTVLIKDAVDAEAAKRALVDGQLSDTIYEAVENEKTIRWQKDKAEAEAREAADAELSEKLDEVLSALTEEIEEIKIATNEATTKDLMERVKNLETNIENIIENTENNIAEVANNVEQNRVNADALLDEKIDNEVVKLSQAIADEASERKQDVENLTNAVNSNANNLVSVQQGLFSNITGVQASLTEAISNEASERATAIDGLRTEMGGEISSKIAELIDNAPESFDTLKEIAEWIASDETKSANLLTAVENAQTTAEQAVNDAANALADAKVYVNEKTAKMVEYTDTSDPDRGNYNRSSIVLKNHDNILGFGQGEQAGPFNLVMVSKWNVADFGSASIHMNLNSLNGEVTINDDKIIATIDDVETKVSEPKEFVILKSPLGKLFKLSVDEEGNLTTEEA